MQPCTHNVHRPAGLRRDVRGSLACNNYTDRQVGLSGERTFM